MPSYTEKIYKLNWVVLLEMKITLEKVLVYTLPVWLSVIILLLSEQATPHGLNRVFALAGLAIVGMTFLIGPLARYSKRINRLKIHRRYLGVAGFLVLLIHSIISFWLFYSLDLGIMFNPANPLLGAALSGTMCFLIFLAMTITSTKAAMRMMGRNWKLLQNTGYLAMVFSMSHFAWTQLGLKGVIATNLVAWIVFFFGLAVIFARLFVYFASMRKQK
jgi:sulfoxide reductase heme-binding subunit YedZ